MSDPRAQDPASQFPVSPATPTPPVGPNRLLILKQAGFPDDQIQSWAAEKRQILSEAGFSNGAIEGYLTGVTVSDGPSPGLANRVSQTLASGRSIADQATRGDLRQEWERSLNAPARFEPTFQERLEQWITGPSALEQSATIERQIEQLFEQSTGKKMADDPVGFARFQLNDPKARELAYSDPMAWSFSPGEGAVGTMRALKGAKGAGEAMPPPQPPPGPRVTVPESVQKGEALPNAFPLARTTVDGLGTEHEVPIGQLPKAQDFVDAAQIITGEHAAPANTNVPGQGVSNVVSLKTGEVMNAGEREAELARLKESGVLSPDGGEWLTMMNDQGFLTRISKAEFYALIDKYSTKEKPTVEVGAPSLTEPANDIGKTVTGKLLTLYNEHGIHPAEVVHDAQRDVTVAQDLLSKGDDLPAIYGGGAGKPPVPPEAGLPAAPPPERGGLPTPPPPPPGSAADAERRILDTMSIGSEKGGREGYNFNRLYEDFIDKYFPMSKATTEAEKKIGPMGTSANPYQLARLYAGYAGKADHMLNHGVFDFDSYEKIGPSLKEILEPHAGGAGAGDLNGLRAYVKSLRAIELDKRGIATGVDINDAREVVQKNFDTYAETAAKLIVYQNNVAAYLRDSGVLSRKGYFAMLEANKFYTPFARLIEDEHEPSFLGGTLQPRNPIQRIKGSNEKTIDPIESIIRNTYTYVSMAEKNAVSNAMVDMLKRAAMEPEREVPLIPVSEWNKPSKFAGETIHDIDGTPLLPAPDEHLALPPPRTDNLPPDIQPLPLERTPTIMDQGLHDAFRDYLGSHGLPEDDDLVAFLRLASRQPEGDEIRRFVDGKPETYRVDPDIARAMKGLDRQTADFLTKLFSVPAQGVRAGAVLTPDFWGRHILRDFMYAFTTFRGGIFNPADMVRGLTGLVKKDQDYLDWLKSGGANVSFVALDRRYLQNTIDQLADTGLLERAWNVVKNPESDWYETTSAVTTLPFQVANKYLLDPLRMMTELAENASHLGAFKKAMRGMEQEAVEGGQVGVSKPEIQTAGWISRDTAVDAARIGRKTQIWNAISAFANITLQDTDRVARAFKDNPVATGIKIAAGITIPTMLLWIENHDDPRYRELPQWQRDLFWIIPTGRPFDEQGRPNLTSPIFRIPKPWGMGLVFATGVERLLDGFVAHDPSAAERLHETLGSRSFEENVREKAFEGTAKPGEHFVESALHVAIPGLVPNAIVPMAEQWANRSFFTDRTLLPYGAEHMMPEYQYTPYTSELAKAIGPKIAAFPGMREAGLDKGNPLNGVARALTSPALIENYVRGWTGTGGMYVLNAADAALRKTGVLPDPPQPAWKLADYPIIKAFTVRYPTASAQSIQDFQDAYDRNKTIYDTMVEQAKQGNAEAVLKIRQIGGPQMFVQLDGIDKALTAINKNIRDIMANPAIPPDEKRQIIDQEYYGMIQIAEQGRATQRRIDAGLMPWAGAAP